MVCVCVSCTNHSDPRPTTHSSRVKKRRVSKMTNLSPRVGLVA